jgi:hypothetical protein
MALRVDAFVGLSTFNTRLERQPGCATWSRRSRSDDRAASLSSECSATAGQVQF